MKIILFCLQRKVGCPDVKLHLQLLLAQVFSIELCHKVKLFFIILLICSFHKKALQSTVYLITRLIKSILYTVDGEIKSFKECNYVCNNLQLPQDDYLLLFLSCSTSELSFCEAIRDYWHQVHELLQHVYSKVQNHCLHSSGAKGHLSNQHGWKLCFTTVNTPNSLFGDKKLFGWWGLFSMWRTSCLFISALALLPWAIDTC